MSDLFPCKQMPTNNNYRKGFESLDKITYHCPECNAFVSKGDKTCWACKKDIEPITGDRI